MARHGSRRVGSSGAVQHKLSERVKENSNRCYGFSFLCQISVQISCCFTVKNNTQAAEMEKNIDDRMTEMNNRP